MGKFLCVAEYTQWFFACAVAVSLYGPGSGAFSMRLCGFSRLNVLKKLGIIGSQVMSTYVDIYVDML